MKIAKIELFKVPPRWLFLKMTTDDGLTGWGEPVCEGRADTVAAAVKELGAQLIGHSATDVEDAFQLMYRTGFYRGGPILTSAISGIEQAMWDIKGKALGVPVYEMLAARCASGSRCTAGSAATTRATPARRRRRRSRRATTPSR